ncbi:MAG: hypothetical protein FJZ07_01220 [Candidatus Nealsonbacteria bacterium]|nr:hypothetical protein [Candidatus Nealsonbacteria bacterium]
MLKKRARKKFLSFPKKKRNKEQGKKIKKGRNAEEKPRVLDDFKKAKIRIIGIGGGAGSIISEITSRVKKADFVAVNTDTRALRAIKKAKRFQFGQNLTQGLGAGMNVNLGEAAAQEAGDKIKQLFTGYDLCIIIACLGGGTSSGATPIFAKFSRGTGCQTYGIFTLPFKFEGERKMEIAKESLLKTKPYLNVFSVMPNENIFQSIDKNTPLREAFSVVNKRLAENLEGLIEMIYLPGLINIDFADLKTILSGRGRLACLNTLEIGEADLDKEEVLKKVIFNPLYPYTIKGARDILYNIVGGKDLRLSRVSQISRYISELVNKNARIIFGIAQNKSHREKIKITLLATGCGNREGTIIKPNPRARSKPKLQPPKLLPPQVSKKPDAVKKKILESNPQPQHQPKSQSQSQPHFQSKSKTDSFSKREESGSKSKPKSNSLSFAQGQKKEESGEKIRRNALQLKKVIEQEEKDLLEKERALETPAILRQNK